MNQQDTLKEDSLASRPLPKWLVDQKEGVTLHKPGEVVLKEDHSLAVSFIITGLVVLLSVILVTILIKRKKKE
jgi:hypothetical protein